jgi:putative transcriptional regulator
MNIKIRLKEILAERDMSQRQLAQLMNLRPNTINHLCSDNVDRVYIRTLEHICEALNISIHELIVDDVLFE